MGCAWDVAADVVQEEIQTRFLTKSYRRCFTCDIMLTMGMVWVPLKSEMLDGFDYDPAMRSLRVRFKRGDERVYQGVPPDIAKGLAEAPSAGRYFHQSIKDQFVGF